MQNTGQAQVGREGGVIVPIMYRENTSNKRSVAD